MLLFVCCCFSCFLLTIKSHDTNWLAIWPRLQLRLFAYFVFFFFYFDFGAGATNPLKSSAEICVGQLCHIKRSRLLSHRISGAKGVEESGDLAFIRAAAHYATPASIKSVLLQIFYGNVNIKDAAKRSQHTTYICLNILTGAARLWLLATPD